MSKHVTLIKNEKKYDQYFHELEKALAEINYTTSETRLDWDYKTISASLEHLESQQWSDTVIAFSLNAFFALYIKSERIKKLILISPSPFYSEYLGSLPKYVIQKLGKKRVSNIKKSFSIENITHGRDVIILTGSNEPQLVRTVSQKIPNSYFLIVDKAGHSLNDYTSTIKNILSA